LRVKRGTVFAENEYRILQTLRVGMARSLGRPAEKERRETVRTIDTTPHLWEAAVEALYDWVGDKKHVNQVDAIEHENAELRLLARGATTGYDNVRYKMRTLFAGLIDFEQKQEKQKNGL